MEFKRNEDYFQDLMRRLDQSSFRSSFHLKKKELAWLEKNGMETCRKHARDFIETRLAAANPVNDGKQTPMKGHPVFVAQHATGCCCRGCLEKWHHIPKGRPLNDYEKQYIEEVLMTWIEKEERMHQKSPY